MPTFGAKLSYSVVVALGARRVELVHRRHAPACVEDARVEHVAVTSARTVAKARGAAYVGHGVAGVDAFIRLERHLATCHRRPAFNVTVGFSRHESWTNTPDLILVLRRLSHAEIDVFPGRAVESRVAADGRDPSRQHRVEGARVIEVRAGGAREVGGIEHAVRRVVRRVDAERQRRHDLLCLHPSAHP